MLGEQAQAKQEFESFERAVHQRFVAAERAVLASELQGLDVDVPEVSIGGRSHRRVLRCTETYLSAVGPITVQRTLYRAGSEPAVVAMELRAGIVAGYWTPRAARQASLLTADLTPQESADVAAGVGQHESVQEQPGPAAEAPEQPLGAGARSVRGLVACGHAGGAC
ncbi:MAG: hypothetical protein OXC31_15470 [Spirochaetaceae bacterium]|nr:hypothetical protein [Spirochaetaceae bacterium]